MQLCLFYDFYPACASDPCIAGVTCVSAAAFPFYTCPCPTGFSGNGVKPTKGGTGCSGIYRFYFRIITKVKFSFLDRFSIASTKNCEILVWMGNIPSFYIYIYICI